MKDCKMEFYNNDGLKTFESEHGEEYLAEDLKAKYLDKCQYIKRIVRKQCYTHEEVRVFYAEGYGGMRLYTIH